MKMVTLCFTFEPATATARLDEFLDVWEGVTGKRPAHPPPGRMEMHAGVIYRGSEALTDDEIAVIEPSLNKIKAICRALDQKPEIGFKWKRHQPQVHDLAGS